jgi:hypothetical protein
MHQGRNADMGSEHTERNHYAKYGVLNEHIRQQQNRNDHIAHVQTIACNLRILRSSCSLFHGAFDRDKRHKPWRRLPYVSYQWPGVSR